MMTLKVKPLNSQPDHCGEPSARESVWVCLGRLHQGQSPRNGYSLLTHRPDIRVQSFPCHQLCLNLHNRRRPYTQ